MSLEISWNFSYSTPGGHLSELAGINLCPATSCRSSLASAATSSTLPLRSLTGYRPPIRAICSGSIDAACCTVILPVGGGLILSIASILNFAIRGIRSRISPQA